VTRNQLSGVKSSDQEKPCRESVVARFVDSEKPTPTAADERNISIFARSSADPRWACLKNVLQRETGSFDRCALLHLLFNEDRQLAEFLSLHAAGDSAADPAAQSLLLKELSGKGRTPNRLEFRPLVEGLVFFEAVPAACASLDPGLPDAQRAFLQYCADGNLSAFVAAMERLAAGRDGDLLQFHMTDSINKRVKQLLVRLFERLGKAHKFVLQRVAGLHPDSQRRRPDPAVPHQKAHDRQPPEPGRPAARAAVVPRREEGPVVRPREPRLACDPLAGLELRFFGGRGQEQPEHREESAEARAVFSFLRRSQPLRPAVRGGVKTGPPREQLVP
jgi:hypothetical protein